MAAARRIAAAAGAAAARWAAPARPVPAGAHRAVQAKAAERPAALVRALASSATRLSGASAPPPPADPALVAADQADTAALEALRQRIADAFQIRQGHGDVVPTEQAQAFCAYYLQLPMDDRRKLLRLLSVHFGVRSDKARQAARAYLAAGDAGSNGDRREQRLLQELAAAVRPVHAVLFSAISQLPEGMEFILQVRTDLHQLHAAGPADPALQQLDDALKAQLQAWFALGFLQLRRISWETPAVVLEMIMKYEAVHAIGSWAELKQRLVGPERTCYGFFHPSLPHVPLVFVEVALTSAIATSIQAILKQPTPTHGFAPPPPEPTTAVFYSITSTQAGLSGVELGNLLIKRVVQELRGQHPALSTFVTLSPIPGFMRWLRARAAAAGDAAEVLRPDDAALLAELRPGEPPLRALLALLDGGAWAQDAALAEALKPAVMRAGAHYLLREKKRKQALDPVTNFHVRNGAWLWQLNWLADTSARGLAQSAGLMVNYRYILEDIDANNRQYLADGRIAASDAVRALLA